MTSGLPFALFDYCTCSSKLSLSPCGLRVPPVLPESLHIIDSLRVALRGPVVDSARANEHFVLAVEEPLGSNVVQSLVQKHKGATWNIDDLCGRSMPATRHGCGEEECKGAPPELRASSSRSRRQPLEIDGCKLDRRERTESGT